MIIDERTIDVAGFIIEVVRSLILIGYYLKAIKESVGFVVVIIFRTLDLL